MHVGEKNYRTVWLENTTVCLIEQNKLPFSLEVFRCADYQMSCKAIKTMQVRGAGAIGATAAYAMAQAFCQAPADKMEEFVTRAKHEIEQTRPTANNLFYTCERVFRAALHAAEPAQTAIVAAEAVADEDAHCSKAIGIHGVSLIHENMGIATHCNAGWLAFVDYGTALSPIYAAHAKGLKPKVFVDETRPRLQGARLTCWELNNAGIENYLISDNATATYMANGSIQVMIVGADRIAANGDVANKIGTLEKAIIAAAYNVPFYVAAPRATIDMQCPSGADIPIENRSENELLYLSGLHDSGVSESIRLAAPGTQALNPAFDVTPAQYIAGIITEQGIVQAEQRALEKLMQN